MGTGASSLPHVEGFGTTGGVRIDRSSRLDLPWKTLLAEIGDADVEMLQQMADECSDEELHCCRAFFRAFRALSCKNLENEELHRQMYFVAAQSPKSLLVFYSILHQCALLGVESLEPIPELASEFVQTALDSYVAEKNFENVLEVEEVNVDAMRGIICAYVEELLDILTNSALAEPQCSVVDGETQFMLEYDLLQVCLGAHGASVVNLRVGENLILVRAEENEKQIFRCASSPENSSLINQVG
jgi:hypothetical protein